MSKRQALMVIGVWSLILPFLGFTDDWKKGLAFLTGLVIIVVAYRLKPEGGSDTAGASGSSAPYVDHHSDNPPTS